MAQFRLSLIPPPFPQMYSCRLLPWVIHLEAFRSQDTPRLSGVVRKSGSRRNIKRKASAYPTLPDDSCYHSNPMNPKCLRLLVVAFVAPLLASQAAQPATNLSSTGLKLQSFVNVQKGMEDLVDAPPSLLDAKTTEFVFGRLVSQKTLAVQVTVTNRSKSNDLLVSEISLSFCPGSPAATPTVPGTLPCNVPFSLSGLDKTVLQGLADRGQSKDLRNLFLRIIEGIGAAAVPFPTFIRHIGRSFTPGVAAWNGPFTAAYKTVFPDYTVNQVIRLSNIAFTTNKVVSKGSSETVVAFIPLEVLFSKKQIRAFRSDAHDVYMDLAQRSLVRVDANFIEPVRVP